MDFLQLYTAALKQIMSGAHCGLKYKTHSSHTHIGRQTTAMAAAKIECESARKRDSEERERGRVGNQTIVRLSQTPFLVNVNMNEVG